MRYGREIASGAVAGHRDPVGPAAELVAVPVEALANEHHVLQASSPGWSVRSLVEGALDRAGVSPLEITTVADGMTMLGTVISAAESDLVDRSQ